MRLAIQMCPSRISSVFSDRIFFKKVYTNRIIRYSKILFIWNLFLIDLIRKILEQKYNLLMFCHTEPGNLTEPACHHTAPWSLLSSE